MREQFTQGTIIETIRSQKYPGIRCKGVVITARCDLFQDKVKFFHCLTALTLEDWISQVLFHDILQEKKQEIFGKIKQYSEGKSIDFETLIHMGPDKALIVMSNLANKKEKDNITKWIDEWKQLEEFTAQDWNEEAKRSYLRDNAKKLLEAKLKQLYNSSYPKYAFLPRKAYCTDPSSVDGLVVDLQDITQFSMHHKDAIMNNLYDYPYYKGTDATEINRQFFFENEDDFVVLSNTISSPWIEYIMQHFAHSFIRIGVDNAFDYEIKQFCKNYMEDK